MRTIVASLASVAALMGAAPISAAAAAGGGTHRCASAHRPAGGSRCTTRTPRSRSSAARPRLFAPNSVWNAPVPDTAPLDPSSAARVAAFNSEIGAEIGHATGPWINETSFSTPFYTVPADQPKVRVVLDAGAWGAALQRALDVGVPIPVGARPAEGTDGHLTVYQPASDTLWEFWKAVRMNDGWHASWGGSMRDVSKSPGYYTSRSWAGLSGSEGWNWGASATSLPIVAGTIMIDELRRGRIDHALALDVPDACATIFSWPAQRTDGTLRTRDCMPEGAHLRIDPAVDLSTLRLPRITRILARAAQRYGVIVRDRTWHATGFFAEDPGPTGTDPYSGPNGLYGGLRPWNFLPQFPWDKLRLLRMSVCRRAPCPPPGA
jgi:hypothetical protein